ncbi:DUF3461 family protein [Pararhizobium sp.]|uniref:DUF3461 family protein n=1 Tax=Pararhizobium sp. TaxID=1977563 RepID=UPI002719D583|nr:DUF3461 family protein [Pararhizobium sp.]MDO9417762.1 DUF3461 family protein [Pararhizobium sp.]
MSDKYPTLALMGILNPEQIVSHSLVNISAAKDLLRIKYQRKPGSLLPMTRGYEFDRIPRASDPNATIGGELTVYEISPTLDEALQELRNIVDDQGGRSALIASILGQIDDMESEFATELAGLRAKLKQLQTAS